MTGPTIDELAAALDRWFAVERYEGEPGVFVRSARPIRRIGLLLEPNAALPELVEQHQLDALFLHRPWKLAPGSLPADCGVLAYHLAFDEHLTPGYSPRLADVLGLRAPAPFGSKQGRPLGMIGELAEQPFAAALALVSQIFGGYEQAIPAGMVRRAAVVGAMTDALVRDAAAHGAELYITGQLRKPAAAAVAETGMGVIAVGHRRAELWGLRALAGMFQERWHGLAALVLDA